MPIHKRKDKSGYYYQWGNHGAHYYFTKGDEESEKAAKEKAHKQAKAAYSHGYKGK